MNKTDASMISAFLTSKTYAFVGATDNPKKFGFSAYKDLKKRGLKVYPVNPNYSSVQGDPCFPSLSAMGFKPDAVISMVPKQAAAGVVEETAAAGITQLWIQWKSDTEEAVRLAMDKGLNVVHGECILMHVTPVKSVHGFHRWIRKLFGRMPA